MPSDEQLEVEDEYWRCRPPESRPGRTPRSFKTRAGLVIGKGFCSKTLTVCERGSPAVRIPTSPLGGFPRPSAAAGTRRASRLLPLRERHAGEPLHVIARGLHVLVELDCGAAGLALLAAVTLDGVPENLALGVSLGEGKCRRPMSRGEPAVALSTTAGFVLSFYLATL